MMDEQPVEPPQEFVCALTMDVMTDPVVSRYGQNFERTAILQWLARGNATCPMTRQPLKVSDLVSNHQLRARIRRWQIENQEDITDNETSDDSLDICPLYFGFITIPECDRLIRPEDDITISGDPTSRNAPDRRLINLGLRRPGQSRRERRPDVNDTQSRSNSQQRQRRMGLVATIRRAAAA